MPEPVCYSLSDLANWSAVGASLQPPARLAVIGDPIAHSKSPQMHNPALRERGIDAQYIRVQVPVGQVGQALRLFARQGFLGVNVTIPHKFEALEGVDTVEPLARQLGAVNTVAIRDGKLWGYNSDGPGFLRSVAEAFGVEVKEQRVLILGAGGGAGQAVAIQCALEGCPALILVNRTQAKSERLAASLASTHAAVRAVAWEETILRSVLPDVDLIVNATSLGMKPDDPPLLPGDALAPRHRVFDMVYRSGGVLTGLGAMARDAGAAYIDGATLLLHQGAYSFEYWFGKPAPVETMRAALREAINPSAAD